MEKMKKQDPEKLLYFPTKDPNAVVDRMVDMVGYVSAENSSPQGCPLTNLPRITNDQFGIITPQGLKNKARTTAMRLFGLEIFMRKGAVIDTQVLDVAKGLGLNVENSSSDDEDDEDSDEDQADNAPATTSTSASKKKLSLAQKNDTLRELCRRYWDIRLFGGAITTKAINTPILGPVQCNICMSLDPIEILQLKITRGALSNEAKKLKGDPGTFGDLPVVRFGLYQYHITVNPYQAENTGCTWGDLDKFVHTLQYMWSQTKAANRSGMAFERLDIYEHENKGGSVPSERILRECKVKLAQAHLGVDCPLPTSVTDYAFVEEPKIPHVTHTKITLMGGMTFSKVA